MKKKFLFVIIALAAIILSRTAYYFYEINTRNVIENLAGNKQMINVLIAGSNVYNENRHRFYAVLSINTDNYKMGITFIPPELRLDIEGDGEKIKKLEEIDFSNFKKVEKALSRELKLQIPFYIELYSIDIKRFVDLIEGVDIFILAQSVGNEKLNFGINYFDGEKIARYINSVEENSIFRKYDRIQDIILSLFNNRESYKKFSNTAFISEAVKNIKTNLLPQEIKSMADLIYSAPSIISIILPGRFLSDNFYSMDDITYKIYEEEFLKRLVLNEEKDSSIKIKILNATKIPGLARKMRSLLIRDGLSVVEFGTSPYMDMKNSIIIIQKGNVENVTKLAELVGVDKIYHVIDGTLLHSVLIIIGEDFAK